MVSVSYQTPDLASVLATLAAHSRPPQSNPAALSSSPPFTPAHAAPQDSQDLEEGEYDPAEFDPTAVDPAEPVPLNPPLLSALLPPLPPHAHASIGFPHPSPSLTWKSIPNPSIDSPAPHLPRRPLSAGARSLLPHALSLDPRLKPPSPTSHPPLSKPSPEPSAPSSSKITTWAPALRHVTKLVVPNPDVTRRITHLIYTQHKHERQWWSGREALVQKLESREEGRKKLNDVLASVGGTIQPNMSPSSSSPSELVVYDRKVYRACTAMSAATTAELARLGVPFFALDPALIEAEEDEKEEGGSRREDREKKEGRSGKEEGKKEKGGEEHTGKISRKELEELKFKMLTLLQDLCGE